jgi:hypothetical protein
MKSERVSEFMGVWPRRRAESLAICFLLLSRPFLSVSLNARISIFVFVLVCAPKESMTRMQPLEKWLSANRLGD